MAAPPEGYTWVAHPDLVVSAIKLLAAAVVLFAGALVSTLLYIWTGTKGQIAGIDAKVDSIAVSLNTLATTTTKEIAVIKATCDERHSQRMTGGRRSYDPPESIA